jgi:antitoxin VapB
LAEASGLSITEAVLTALQEKLRRTTGRTQRPSLGDEVRQIGSRCAALPDLDTQAAGEISAKAQADGD